MRHSIAILLIIGSSVMAAAPATQPAGDAEFVTDWKQLDRTQRVRQIRDMCSFMVSHPKSPLCKPWTGLLILLKDDLQGFYGDMAADALAAVTGEHFGKDFTAWAKWHDGVKHDPAWQPPTLRRQKATAPPAQEFLWTQTWIILFAPEIQEEKDGTRVLSGPADIHSKELELHVVSESPMRVKLLDFEGRLEVKGDLTVTSGRVTGYTREIVLNTNGAQLDLLDLPALRKVPQSVDEQRLRDDDPLKVIQYVRAEAVKGNLLPQVRLELAGRGRRPAKEPADRDQLIRELKLTPAEAKAMSLEQLLAEVLRQREYNSLLRVTDVKVEKSGSDRVRWTEQRVDGSGSGTLIKTDKGWVPD